MTAFNTIFPPAGGGGSMGTVTSVDVSTGATGLTSSGGPITTSGTITLAGTLAVSHGGTGVTSYTAGSVPYSNGTLLTQDNSNLFWDSTHHRLGVGNTAPHDPLDVTGSINVSGVANNALFLGVNQGSGANQMALYAYGGVKLDWQTQPTNSALQLNDNLTDTQIIARGSHGLTLAVDGSSAATGVVVAGASGQTNDLLDVQDSAASVKFKVATTGAVTLGATSTTPTHVLNAAHTTGAQAATITNSPVAGDPAGFLTVTINGVTSYIPYWQ